MGNLARFCIAMALLSVLMNLDELTSRTRAATSMMREVEQAQNEGAIESYFGLCRDKILKYYFKSRSTRREYLGDLKQYTVVVFLTLHNKNTVIRRCLEHCYTLSKTNFGVDFGEYMKRMVAVLDGDKFESKFQEVYQELSARPDVSASRMEKVADYMLEQIRSTDFGVLADEKAQLTEDMQVIVKKLYLVDKAHAEFGVEVEDILKLQSGPAKDRKVVEKFMKIAEALKQ